MAEKKEDIIFSCHSREGFNDVMRHNNWYNQPGEGVATISICSQNDDDPTFWFPPSSNSLNLIFDDFDPSVFWDGSIDYNTMFNDFIDGNTPIDLSEDLFEFYEINSPTGKIKAMDLNDAEAVVRFIIHHIKKGTNEFYVHCSAGLSRSQGIVRYFLDTYGNIFNVITNPDNPCLTPNWHVVRMLKRMDRSIYQNI